MARSKSRVYEDALLEKFKDEYRQYHQTMDYQCLQKYDQQNKHFSMEVVTVNKGEEQERVIGYDCIYRYGPHEVKLEYDIPTGKWRLVSDKYHLEEEKKLNTMIEFINMFPLVNRGYTLDEKVQRILKMFDYYFLEPDKAKKDKENEEKILKSSSAVQKEHEVKYVNDEFLELSSHDVLTPLTYPEDDEQHEQKYVVHDGPYSSISKSRTKMTGLVSRSIAPICHRRVIESILLHVQRKKKTSEKIVDVLKGTKRPAIHELGLEFLRVYDGKFNYREGHTFVMPFRKKFWFLTIEQIKYIDCSMDEIGPRSVLVLNYKGQYTNVHV